MKIQKITSRNRRDFSAILVCESCGAEEKLIGGYDDDHYHQNVIPNMKCESCGEKAPSNYNALSTKYNQHTVV